MKQIICKDYLELSAKSAFRIANVISKKPDALLCFPAGETSIGTFKQLIDLYKSGNISFQKCKIVGLDEWKNLKGQKNENCLSFLKKHLFDHIDYSVENFCFFDGESPDPEDECRKTDDFIKKYGPIDVILLGVGMNGHLGLNEPGTSFNLYSHLVKLDEITKTVGQKYFSGKAELNLGITLGLKHIMEAREVILQVSGNRKAEVVRKLLKGDISPAFPASIVKSHPNAYLFLDKESSVYL